MPAGEGGRQSLVSENVWDAVAPPGTYVTVQYQDVTLKAKHVRADYGKKTVVAEGDVVLVQGTSRLTGARLDLDLMDKVGVLTDGAVDLEGGVFLRGARLSKIGPRSYAIADGTVTACEGENPAWRFKVRKGRVTLDEYARLSDVVFEMGGVPLLYTPYLVWPALRDRASGFLIPGVGYNSNRGAYLGLSYFWAIDRSWDATFSLDGYSEKFFGAGAELRARPSLGTRAEGIFYAVHDPERESWRWKTRGTLVADDLGPRLRGVLSWLDFSDQEFLQQFDRDFDLTTARSIKSEAFLTYSPDPFALNLRVGRDEALFGGGSSAVTERRPVLEARLRPTPLLSQRLFVEAEGQAGLLRVDRGPGQPAGLYDRLDLFPKLTAPLSPLPWLSLQAVAGGRVTSYGKSLETAPGATPALVEERYTRSYAQAGLEATGPSFSRIFEPKKPGGTKLKHVLEPRFDYQYTTNPTDLSRTPLFDEVDSIAPAHTLRYALVQRLLAKSGDAAAREVASFEISRLHYFRLPGEGTPTGALRGLSRDGPIDAALRVYTGGGVSLDARTTYDAKARQVTSASVSANLAAGERTLNLSIFDSRPVGAPSSAQVRLSGGLPILPKRLRADAQAAYDLSQSKLLELRGLLTVEGSCFKILAEYRELRIGSVPSRDFRIGLNLKHVGSFLDFTGSL